MASPYLPNNPDNYMSPSAISVWFSADQGDGTYGAWKDLGNILDISLALTDEKLIHESARHGLLAEDKVVISKVTGMLNFTIDEFVSCNLLYMFRPATAPNTADTLLVLGQKRIRLTGTDAKVIDYLAVEDGATDYLDLEWLGVSGVLVRSTDGSTTYSAVTDYTFTQAAGTGSGRTPATIARQGGGTIASGSEVMVTYQYSRNVVSYKLQEGGIIEGALRLQLLNRIGPLCAWEFPRVSLNLNGDLAVNPSEFIKQPMSAQILTDGEGNRGEFFLFDHYNKLEVASCD